jgi:DNA-binding Lrp family transcriptional regulator
MAGGLSRTSSRSPATPHRADDPRQAHEHFLFGIPSFSIVSTFDIRHSTFPRSPPVDDLDRRIIAGLRDGLPDTPQPWHDAASSLGMPVDELLRRVEAMVRDGVVRSVRAVLDQRQVGLAGNALVAWSVPAERVEEVGRLFASRPDVSHCYERPPADDWPCNVYTMVHAESDEACAAAVEAMSRESGVTERVMLRTVRELKKTPPRYFP